MPRSVSRIKTGGFNLKITKSFFLDRQKVIKSLDRKERRAMSKIGAFARRHMQSTFKRRGKSAKTRYSKPGQPPRVGSGSLLKKHVYFGYKVGQGLIVGPALISARGRMKPQGKASVPQLLEEGGSGTTSGHWTIVELKSKKLLPAGSPAFQAARRKLMSYRMRNTRYRDREYSWKRLSGSHKYQPRPFKAKALEKTISDPKLKSAWKVL